MLASEPRSRVFPHHDAFPTPDKSPSISGGSMLGANRLIGWLTLSSPMGPSAAAALVGKPCNTGHV